MKKIRLVVLACVFSLTVIAFPTLQSSKVSAGANEKFRQREVVVRLKRGKNISAILARHGISLLEKSRGAEEYRLALPANANLTQKLAQMASDTDLALAAPNYIYQSPEILQGEQVF